jgi:hypothetical protein
LCAMPCHAMLCCCTSSLRATARWRLWHHITKCNVILPCHALHHDMRLRRKRALCMCTRKCAGAGRLDGGVGAEPCALGGAAPPPLAGRLPPRLLWAAGRHAPLGAVDAPLRLRSAGGGGRGRVRGHNGRPGWRTCLGARAWRRARAQLPSSPHHAPQRPGTPPRGRNGERSHTHGARVSSCVCHQHFRCLSWLGWRKRARQGGEGCGVLLPARVATRGVAAALLPGQLPGTAASQRQGAVRHPVRPCTRR